MSVPSERQRVTLDDIARRLGISRTTVSLVVNDHPRISDRTKQKVRKCIKELGYRPDHYARALATGRSNLIGYIVPDISNPYFADIFRGAEDSAAKLGYHLLLNNGSYDLNVEEQRVLELLNIKVAGLLVSPAFITARQATRLVWKDLRDRNFPIVLVNRHMEPPIFHQIAPDDDEGMRLSIDALFRLGHRRVAYISGKPEALPVRQRMKAYRRYASQYGFDPDPELFEVSAFTPQGGYEAGGILWERLASKPTAIICINDTIAVGVTRYLHERDVRVPDDVSVMGFDGTVQGEYSWIGISTIETPRYEIGKTAVEMVDKAIRGDTEGLQNVILPVRYIARESTAPPMR